MIELLVVIAIIALLAAILLPSLKRARERAQESIVTSNMAQIALATHAFAGDREGWAMGLNRTQSAQCGGIAQNVKYAAGPEPVNWTGSPTEPVTGGKVNNSGLYHLKYLPNRRVFVSPINLKQHAATADVTHFNYSLAFAGEYSTDYIDYLPRMVPGSGTAPYFIKLWDAKVPQDTIFSVAMQGSPADPYIHPANWSLTTDSYRNMANHTPRYGNGRYTFVSYADGRVDRLLSAAGPLWPLTTYWDFRAQ